MERYSWIRRTNIVKMTTLPQSNLHIQHNPYLTTNIFHWTRTKNSTILWKSKRPWIDRAILKKKKQSWRHQPSWLQTIHQPTVIKTAWYWYKSRNKGQRNKIESPEVKPCINGHCIFDKEGKNIKWRKDSLFNK